MPTPLGPRSMPGLAILLVILAERSGPEVASLISTTVERWDADETSQRLELQVGRDLQFIRINGTLVGGLAGLIIHALVVTLRWLSMAPRPRYPITLCTATSLHRFDMRIVVIGAGAVGSHLAERFSLTSTRTS